MEIIRVECIVNEDNEFFAILATASLGNGVAVNADYRTHRPHVIAQATRHGFTGNVGNFINAAMSYIDDCVAGEKEPQTVYEF